LQGDCRAFAGPSGTTPEPNAEYVFSYASPPPGFGPIGLLVERSPKC